LIAAEAVAEHADNGEAGQLHQLKLKHRAEKSWDENVKPVQN
jgi:hypothetical protein